MNCIFIIALIAGLVFTSGCDSEAKRKAQQEAADQKVAIGKLRDEVATMKVRMNGAIPYQDFQEQKIGVESCYEANKKYLAGVTNFERLDDLLITCDYCWSYSIQTGGEVAFNPNVRNEDRLAMIICIGPSITNKMNFTLAERRNDLDFSPRTCAEHAQQLIVQQCDLLLNEIQ